MPAEGSGAERGGGSAPRAAPRARPSAPLPAAPPPEPPAGRAGRGAQRHGRTVGQRRGVCPRLLWPVAPPAHPDLRPPRPPEPLAAPGLPPCRRRRGAPTARVGPRRVPAPAALRCPRCRGGGGASRGSRGRPAAPATVTELPAPPGPQVARSRRSRARAAQRSHRRQVRACSRPQLRAYVSAISAHWAASPWRKFVVQNLDPWMPCEYHLVCSLCFHENSHFHYSPCVTDL